MKHTVQLLDGSRGSTSAGPGQPVGCLGTPHAVNLCKQLEMYHTISAVRAALLTGTV